MAYEEDTDRIYATFIKHDEFTGLQAKLLSLDLFVDPTADENNAERQILQKLCFILNEYQEQAYLLDPYLEELLNPVIERFKNHARTVVADPKLRPSSDRLHCLGLLVYQYIKFRGSKTIVRFFPHEVDDLSVALNYIRLPNSEIIESQYHWATRYVILLWLALICRIPFSLSQFDEPGHEGTTATALESLGKEYLDRAGLEREGAAVLLSRLYMREDTGPRFSAFVSWANEHIQSQGQVFTTIGILQVFGEVLKAAPLDLIKNELPKLLALVTSMGTMKTLNNNVMVRKLRTKIITRTGLRLLPPNPNAGRRKGRTLTGDELELGKANLEESEVPEEIEVILEELLSSLEDKDTVVRYPAAKGVARIAEHLPSSFSSQIVENVLAMFSTHSLAAAALYDLPAIAEYTWHGACLASAELARRNQISDSNMPDLVEWLSKALYFDIRKGSHSIGSNVRDAAAYVLWALARTQNPETLKPHATNLANRLASVAIYDREVHIRRAASAAYQEHVGRMSLFPHGIDVLAKTDFYSVSIRRNAFLVAAAEVSQHAEYRDFLLGHVLNVVLRHWDVSIRELGSQSLKNLCLIDLENMAATALRAVVPLLESIDPADIHGGLIALTELGNAIQVSVVDPKERSKKLRAIFSNIAKVSFDHLKAPRNHLLTAAACKLIAATLTIEEIEAGSGSSVPIWRRIIERSKDRSTLFAEARSGGTNLVKSVGKILGALGYEKNGAAFPKAISFLLEHVKPSHRATIEARRSCYISIQLTVSNIFPQRLDLISPSLLDTLLKTLLNGLDDYTIDERGDVGSWIRLVCIQGLTSLCALLFTHSGRLPGFESYPPPSLYTSIASGILKQGVERLDNVRQDAGKCFLRLLTAAERAVADGVNRWQIPAQEILRDLFQSESEPHDWADGTWLFPRAVKLLGVEEYRRDLLTGFLLSIGSKTDSTQRPASKAVVGYMADAPVAPTSDAYSLSELVDDLLHRVTSNVASNSIVIPIFQTFNLMLEADIVPRLAHDDAGYDRLQKLLSCATRGVTKWKNVERINEAMKIVVALLAVERVRERNLAALHSFLAHPFPKIRYGTAEHLYMQVESVDYGIDDTSDIESILLETTWTTINEQEARAASERVVELFTTE